MYSLPAVSKKQTNHVYLKVLCKISHRLQFLLGKGENHLQRMLNFRSGFANVQWWVKCLIFENTCGFFSFHKFKKECSVISTDPSSSYVT